MKSQLPHSFLAVLILGLTAVAQAAPLAILTDVRGSVQIVRAGKTSAGKTGAQLQAGDVVRVAQGSATIYYATRAPQKLGASQQVKISASGNVAQPSPWRNVYAGLSQGFARRRTGTATVRPGTVEFIAPAGLSGEARPLFLWSLNQINPTAIADYVVTVKDAAGKTVWEQATAARALEYSADAPALEPGHEYLWTVAGRQEDEILGDREVNPAWVSLTATFQIATPDEVLAARREQDELKSALQDAPESTRRLALAAALAQRGLATEAIALLTSLSRREVEQGSYRAKLDALLPQMDEATRVLLRGLFITTGQNNLAAKIELPPEAEDEATQAEKK
jgi:hypothetical protein